MLSKTTFILTWVVLCESTYMYSSFWAPLFDPRILNYRVDGRFDPDAGRAARDHYARSFGPRGETLIADLGNGRGPTDRGDDTQLYGHIQLTYTYPDHQGPPGTTRAPYSELQ